jgi:hypothetical protein
MQIEYNTSQEEIQKEFSNKKTQYETLEVLSIKMYDVRTKLQTLTNAHSKYQMDLCGVKDTQNEDNKWGGRKSKKRTAKSSK